MHRDCSKLEVAAHRITTSSWKAALVGCLLATTGIAHAQAYDPNADAAAQRAFDKGQAALERGHFGDAVQQFEKSYELSHRPQILYSIGRAADADGQNERALRAYQAYLQSHPDPQTRSYAEARVAKLQQMVPPPAPQPRTGSSSTPNPWGATAAQPQAQVAPPPPAPGYYAPQQQAPGGYYAPSPSYPGSTGYQTGSAYRLHPNPFQVYGGFRIGVGGSVKRTSKAKGYEDGKSEADLKNTVGFQFGASYALHQFVALGGEIRLNAVKIEGYTDRAKIWDFTFKPRVRYELPTLPIEIYGTLPVGLSVLQGSNGADSEVGSNFGVLFGATYFITEKLGINAEMGWQMHFFSTEDKGTEYGDVTTKDRYGYWNLLSASVVVAP